MVGWEGGGEEGRNVGARGGTIEQERREPVKDQSQAGLARDGSGGGKGITGGGRQIRGQGRQV